MPILDQNPPNLKWKSISTPHVKLIFPDYFTSEAQRMAGVLDYIAEPESKTLGADPGQVPIIFQTKNTVPNGFVSVIPHRSEFYTTPPQRYNFLGTSDWLNLLAVHEYRHIVQFRKSRTGFPKFLYYLFGNETWSLASTLGAPGWFWEGDAVNVETLTTSSGRGSIPNFGIQLKTTLLEQEPWSYSKMTLTSLKDFVPNHYVTGYYFVSYFKKKYGVDIWDKIVGRSFAFPYLPFAFSFAVNKYTDKQITDQYEDITRDLKQYWTEQVAGTDENPEAYQNRANDIFTDFSNPVEMESGEVLVLKSGLGDYDQFVKINDQGAEQKVFVPGFMKDYDYFSYRNGKIAWIEYGFDVRYGQENFSQVKVYDVESGNITRIGRETRFNAVDLSPDGSLAAVVEDDEQYNHRIKIIRISDTSLVQRLQQEKNELLLSPRWNDAGDQVAFISSYESKKSLKVWNIETDKITEIIPPSNENIGVPFWYQKWIFYNSPYSGIDNIYAVDIENGNRYRVTNARYGAYNATVSESGDYIYYNNYTYFGNDVVKQKLDFSTWEPLQQVTRKSLDYFEGGVDEALDFDINQLDFDTEYEVSDYREKVLLPYAWSLLSTSSINALDIGLKSRNLLNTLTYRAGYRYDYLNDVGRWFGNLSYQRYFPVIDLQVDAGQRAQDFSRDGSEVTEQWQETNISAGVRLPFNLTDSKFQESLQFGWLNQSTFVNGFDVDRSAGRVGNGQLLSSILSVDYSLLHKTSRRDFVPPWGIQALADWRKSYGISDFSGNQFTAQTSFYTPGLFKHHSLNLRVGYQWVPFGFDLEEVAENQFQPVLPSDLYLYSSRISFPRGASYKIHNELITTSISYQLPVLYPDLPLWAIAYIQRIRVKPFLDYASWNLVYDFPRFNSYEERRSEALTTGVEVRFDFNLGRRLPFFSAGFRYNYNLTEESSSWDFISGNTGL